MATVTEKGLVTERLEDIIQSLEDGFKAIYGENIDVSPNSPDGQMLGLIAQIKTDLEELAQNIYKQLDPYLASGAWLEQRTAYAGVVRRQARYSYLRSVILTGEPYQNIPEGLVVVDSLSRSWVLQKTVQLNHLGSARGEFRSQELGAFFVKSGEKMRIETLIVGLSEVVTSENSQVGAQEETDAELRARFMLSHAKNAVNSVQSMRAKLLSLPDVEQVQILENTSNETDALGVAPHSLNVIVLGGDDKAIASVIYETKGAGAGLQGNTTVSLNTEMSNSNMKFDRPEVVDIFLRLDVVREQDFSQIDTDAIKKELANLYFEIGQDVHVSRLYSPVNKTNGFWVKSLKIGKNNINLANDNIMIETREIARLLMENIHIVVE